MKKKMLCFEIGNQIAKIYFVTIKKRKSIIDAFMMFDTPKDVVYDGNICDAQKFIDLFENKLEIIRKDITVKIYDKSIKEVISQNKKLTLADLNELGYKTVGMLVHSTKIIAKREKIQSSLKVRNKKVKDQILSEFPINKKIFYVFIDEQNEKQTFKERRLKEKTYILTAVPKKIMDGAKKTSDLLGMEFTGLNVVENVYDDSFARKYKNITIVDIGMSKTVFFDVKRGRIINKKVIMYGANEAINSLIKNKVFEEDEVSEIIAKMEKRDCFNHGTDGEYEEEYKDSVVRRLHFLFEEIKDNVLKTDIMTRRKKVVYVTGIASHMSGLELFLQRFLETEVKMLDEGTIYVEEDKLIEQYRKVEKHNDNKTGIILNSNRFAKMFLTACVVFAICVIGIPTVEKIKYKNKLSDLKASYKERILADNVKNAEWKEIQTEFEKNIKNTDKIIKLDVTTKNVVAIIQTSSQEDALKIVKNIEGGKIKQIKVRQLVKDSKSNNWFLSIEGTL
ncbi:hypothetical protein [Lachnobacterium bovis]|uniref:hypothetical protein n=1 Tax=Lachnobacterium bovis TaxID=140626 RepID=UPI0003B58EB2|nr:hypothetical protein [Lachnobacterium bovis]